MKKVLFALLAGLFIFTACDIEDSQKINKEQEPPVETIDHSSHDYISVGFTIDIIDATPEERIVYGFQGGTAIAENIYNFNNLIKNGEIDSSPDVRHGHYFVPRYENINATIKLTHFLDTDINTKDAPVVNIGNPINILKGSSIILGGLELPFDYSDDCNYILFIFRYSKATNSFLDYACVFDSNFWDYLKYKTDENGNFIFEDYWELFN